MVGNVTVQETMLVVRKVASTFESNKQMCQERHAYIGHLDRYWRIVHTIEVHLGGLGGNFRLVNLAAQFALPC